MTYKDYKDWSEEYREQVELISGMIADRKEKSSFVMGKQRQVLEHEIKLLYGMRRDCFEAACTLENKAKRIKEQVSNET